jgi:hypothetical protein
VEGDSLSEDEDLWGTEAMTTQGGGRSPTTGPASSLGDEDEEEEDDGTDDLGRSVEVRTGDGL